MLAIPWVGNWRILRVCILQERRKDKGWWRMARGMWRCIRTGEWFTVLLNIVSFWSMASKLKCLYWVCSELGGYVSYSSRWDRIRAHFFEDTHPRKPHFVYPRFQRRHAHAFSFIVFFTQLYFDHDTRLHTRCARVAKYLCLGRRR